MDIATLDTVNAESSEAAASAETSQPEQETICLSSAEAHHLAFLSALAMAIIHRQMTAAEAYLFYKLCNYKPKAMEATVLSLNERIRGTNPPTAGQRKLADMIQGVAG